MSEIQETKKRLKNTVINSATTKILIETDQMSTFQLTDIIISNLKRKRIILNVEDNDGNKFPLLDIKSPYTHSFPTGLKFWRDAKLVAITPDDMEDNEVLITVGYVKLKETTDINTWRLL